MSLPQQLSSIGLSLSGGGFRAAAFHLGSLSYLNRAGWLPNVTMLSTVSGGTITGAKYALSLLDGTEFRDFFQDYYQILERNELFQKALLRMGEGRQSHTPSGRSNGITSMAHAYTEELFYSQERGRPFLMSDILDGQSHLQEVTFNATDFRSGIAFRFQKSKHGIIGNYYTQLNKADAAKLRIADVVAASSCFPGGFEPLEFPVDFVWPDGQVPETTSSQFSDHTIPLMDGGVYDNQGIDSLLLADKRTDPLQTGTPTRQLDALIVSDTDRRSDELYEFPEPVRDTKNPWLSLFLKWNPTLGLLNTISLVVLLSCLLIIVMVVVDCYQTWPPVTTLYGFFRWFAYIAVTGLAATIALVVGFVRNQVRKSLLPQIPIFGLDGWKELKGIKADQLIDMVNLRMTSLLAMASDVFMKRIRQLGHRLLYQDARYQGKRIANYVYHLARNDLSISGLLQSETKDASLQQELARIPKPTKLLPLVIDCANEMPTTLWFRHPHELPALVAAGQVTMCFNVTKFIIRTYQFSPPAGGFPPEIQPLWNLLMEDWLRFTCDPYCLLRKELDSGELPYPPPPEST